jgi:putative ABC transport system permease protein
VLQDVRLVIRSFRRYPAFAALAAAIVALGAGANAAVFAVVHAVLLRPLPYADPDRLVAIAPGFLSIQDVDFLRARSRSFVDVAASSPGWLMPLTGVGEPVQIITARPSPNLFDLLGVRPMYGRLFEAGDGTAGRPGVIVLGHRLWQARFGGDPKVIGRTITLNGAPVEIVGILPAPCGVLDVEAEAWVPFERDPRLDAARNSLAYARLRPGVDLAAAVRELRGLVPQMRRDTGAGEIAPDAIQLVPLTRAIVGDLRTPLLLVTAAVALLVLLTAANLGTLLLERQIGRRPYAAVRTALGASLTRLAREAIVENSMLAVGGAIAGLMAARIALPALVRILPREMPRLGEVTIDPVVILTVLVASVFAVLIFGVTPSFMATPASVQPLLREGAQTDSRGSRRLLDLLVVSQLALAVVLGLGAALMARSLWLLQHVDPGFDAERVLTVRLQPGDPRYRGPGRILAYYREVSERVAAVPAVTRVGVINHIPLSGYDWGRTVQPIDQPVLPPSSQPRFGWRMIDGDYFATMGIPLRAGRLFATSDTADAPPVVIVNESGARRLFNTVEAALGRRIRMTDPVGEAHAVIVGVVGDVRHRSIALEPEPEFYTPVAQAFGMAMTLVVRTAGPPAAVGASVRAAVWSVDPNVAISGMGPMTTMVRENLGRPRMLATLLLVFAAVGSAIVVCGVYGAVAYTVRRRERELGIRAALGAGRGSLHALVLRQGLRYAAASIIVGLPAALAVGRLMRGVLYGVQPHDVLTVAALCIAVVVTTLLAATVPAVRAGRVDPATVLRA